MPNTANFGVETPGAKVQGTLTDKQIIIPNIPPTGRLAIGNRTSFNFIEEQWNAETSYLYYDVVRDAQGKSYIAIKPMVPAGTPLTDGEHWFLWSEPDVQLEELRRIVQSYQMRIANLESETKNLESETGNIKKDLSNKSNINFKKCITIGDSWSVGYYDGAGHPEQGWPYYMAPFLGIATENLLQMGSGGSGFINSTGEHFKDQILRAHNEHPEFDDADLIVCVGGFNDGQDNRQYEEVKTAAFEFINNCITYYPNAEVHIFPMQLPYGQVMTANRQIVLQGIMDAIYNSTNGKVYFHNGCYRFGYGFGKGASDNDGAHLNQYGYSYLGQICATLIRTKQNFTQFSIYEPLNLNIQDKVSTTVLAAVYENNLMQSLNIDVTVNSEIDANTTIATLPAWMKQMHTKYISTKNVDFAIDSSGEFPLVKNIDKINTNSNIFINETYMAGY